ncbi:unnamed protein product, partial [Meganyctiphanes norvegica]
MAHLSSKFCSNPSRNLKVIAKYIFRFNLFSYFNKISLQKMEEAPEEETKPKTGILMLNMGGPRTTDEVHDFLLRLFSDRDIIQLPAQKYMGPWIAKRRTPSIQEKYSEIGGGSPIYKWTDLQPQAIAYGKYNMVGPSIVPMHKGYDGLNFGTPLNISKLDSPLHRSFIFWEFADFFHSSSNGPLKVIRPVYAAKGHSETQWS